MIIQNNLISFDLLINYLNERDIIEIIGIIINGDEYSRTVARDLLQIIIERFYYFNDIIIESISNECINILNGAKCDEGVVVLIEFLKALVHKIKKLDILVYYEQFIIQVVIKLFHLETFQPLSIIKYFCMMEVKCQKATLKRLNLIFDKIESSSQSKIISIVQIIVNINEMNTSDEDIEIFIGQILKKAFSSESILVIDSISYLFDDESIQKYIEKRINTILPIFFDKMYKASKIFWQKEYRCKI